MYQGKNTLGKIIEFLRPKVMVGGLEISDFAVRFARLGKGGWEFYSERLALGVVQEGAIKDYDAFVDALRKLHAQVLKQISNKKITAVVALSSGNMYSQVFSLPIIEGENLERAIELNLQVVSPEDISREYAGWQILDKDPGSLNLEVLAAFVEKTFANELSRALRGGGFLPLIFEFRALALARLVREQARGFDIGKSYLVLHLGNDGLDSLVIRKGQLYFEYFSFWRDIFQSDEREVPVSVFESAVTRNINQVVNFYNQHWPNDKIASVFISAGELNAEAAKIISENFSLPTAELQLALGPVGSDWLVALGSSLRGLSLRKNDREINFLGVEAKEEFRREHLIRFLEFWRFAIPVTLGAFLALFVAADFLLVKMGDSLRANPLIQSQSEEIRDLELLQTKVRTFNESVNFIRSIRQQISFKAPIFEKVNAFAKANRVTINKFLFTADATIELGGEARLADDVRALKSSIESDGQFIKVNLPITELRPIPGNQGFSFAMTFAMSASKTN